MSKVLFIGAHPDDVELGCGGVINKFCDTDYDVRVIFLAEGTSCRYNKCDIESDDVKKQIKFRTDCAIKSLNHLGVNSYEFYDLPCGRLDREPLIDINKIIEKEINTFKPYSVYTHSNTDTNKDHRIIFESTRIATRPGSKTFVNDVYLYEVLSSTEWNFNDSFNPNIFMGLSESNIQKKIESINKYTTEISNWPYPRSTEGITTLAKYRGMQIGVSYAEAFKLFRSYR
jgi:LmbE family N-acetylglucosaminyl deacetylase